MANFPETRISLILRLAEPEDVAAWQEFVDVYTPALLAVARRQGLQPADAEDVTQEILFAVARAVERFQPDATRARFRTWLSRIARNLIADFRTGRAKRPLAMTVTDSWLRRADWEPRSGDEAPGGVDCDPEFQTAYRAALYRAAAERIRHRVAAKTWNAFQATAVAGQGVEQTADDLGMTPGGVYVARCRVLKMLRREVAEMERSLSPGDDELTREPLP